MLLQHGIPGTACSDDLSLSDALWTAHLSLTISPEIHFSVSKKIKFCAVIQFQLVLLVYELHRNTTEASSHQTQTCVCGYRILLSSKKLISRCMTEVLCFGAGYALDDLLLTTSVVSDVNNQ